MVKNLGPTLNDSTYWIGGIHINTFNAISASEEWNQKASRHLA